jgi:hypothetical protein
LQALEKSVTAQLHIGSVAFNAPTTLDRGETAEIEFLLSPTQSVNQLKSQITKAGVREGTRVEVSDYTEADLTGSDFSITLNTPPPRKLVLPNRTTRWAWEITPTHTGVRHLHLTLTALVTAAGESRELEIRTFEKTVTIRVSWPTRVKDFAHQNWQWLWTAILVPLGAWLIQRKRQPKGKDVTPPTEASP